MPTTREQLLASTFWSIRRPQFVLTPGHFLIRLNDPAIPFGTESAADLLRCYGHLRRAMTELTGATAAQLHMSLNWQPVGKAVGEPRPETSTPTLHVFVAGPGSPTAAAALSLPAHQRVAVEIENGFDDQLRQWGGGRIAELTETAEPTQEMREAADGASDSDTGWAPEGWNERLFHIEPSHPGPGKPFRGGHWTAVPRFSTSPLDMMKPEAALVLADTLTGLATHSSPPFQGMTVWATDIWNSADLAMIHLFGRQHGSGPALLPEFVADGGLKLPVISA